MATLDQLVSQLRTEGAVESTGRFTLDREQARRKMQKFQLADARRYVLELVQAAVLRGAGTIDFDIDADDMRMHFDGEVFTADEFDDLYGSLFSDEQGRRVDGVRQLALALNAAAGMEPKFIEVRSGRVGLTIRPGQDDAIVTLEQPGAGTRIHVRQRLRPRVLFDYFRNLAGRLEEEQFLRQRCGFAGVRVVLEGQQLAPRPKLIDDSLFELGFAGQDYRGVMALIQQDDAAELRLIKDGVWIDQRTLPRCGTHVLAVAEGEGLRKDVSQAKIINNPALERIVAAFAHARWSLWRRALEQLEGKAHAQVEAWIREQLLQHATREDFVDNQDALALAERLRWADARDPSKSVSLRDLLAQRAEGQVPGYAQERYPELPFRAPAIPHIDRAREIKPLRRLLEKLEGQDDALRWQLHHERGRKQWQQRPGDPVLPNHLVPLARAGVQAPGLRGELGVDQEVLAANIAHPLRAMLYLEGHLLGRVEIDVGVPNLWLAVEADFTPAWTYEDAEHDARFAEVLLRSLAAVGQLLPAIFAGFGQADPSNARNLCKRWLALMLIGERRVELLQALKVPSEDIERWRGQPQPPLITSVTPPALLAADNPLADLPLFVDFDGERMTLRELALLRQQTGSIPYLPWRTSVEPLFALPRVARLGVDDQRIVETIFGADVLESWSDRLRERRAQAQHMQKPAIDLAEVLATVREGLIAAEVDPDLFIRTLPEGPRHGFLAVPLFLEGIDEADLDQLQTASLSLLRARREVCSVEDDLGFGPLFGLIDDPDLTLDEGWTEVAEDERYAALQADLRALALDLAAQLCARFDTLPTTMRSRVARMLLVATATARRERDADKGEKKKRRRSKASKASKASEISEANEAERRAKALDIETLPLLATVGGPRISLAEARAALSSHGQLEAIDEALGVEIPAPPILVLDPVAHAAVEQLLGVTLGDGRPRIRLSALAGQLDSLPPLGEARLDPATILARAPLMGGSSPGEIGLSRLRQEGLTLTLGTAGRRLDPVVHDCELPLDAILVDEALPLVPGPRGPVPDVESKHVRNHLRRCRRAMPELIQTLCAARPKLDEADRRHADALLLRHIRAELASGESRREARERALAAAMAEPILRDLWGAPWSVHDAQEFMGDRTIEVLATAPAPMPPGEDARSLGRLILIADSLTQDCLEHVFEIDAIDDRWPQVRADLEALRRAPRVRFVVANDVLTDMKATVSGGLEALLWLPRDHDPLCGPPLTLAFANGERLIADEAPLPALSCAGVVRGALDRGDGGGPALTDKQRSSLERQVLVLYEGLADRVRGNKLSAGDRSKALAYLARAAHELGAAQKAGRDEALQRLGKRIHRLQAKLDEVVPPMLRDAIATPELVTPAKAQAAAEAPASKQPVSEAPAETSATPPSPLAAQAPATQITPEPPPTTTSTATSQASAQAPAAAAAPRVPLPEPPPPDPEQVLLAALYEQLHWARARHGSLLDELGLAQLSIGNSLGKGIVEPGRLGLVVRRDHPIVARLLGQARDGGALDPIDLSFVVATAYTLMNVMAEDIDDDDERAFVAQLAEALALMGAGAGERGAPESR